MNNSGQDNFKRKVILATNSLFGAAVPPLTRTAENLNQSRHKLLPQA